MPKSGKPIIFREISRELSQSGKDSFAQTAALTDSENKASGSLVKGSVFNSKPSTAFERHARMRMENSNASLPEGTLSNMARNALKGMDQVAMSDELLRPFSGADYEMTDQRAINLNFLRAKQKQARVMTANPAKRQARKAYMQQVMHK